MKKIGIVTIYDNTNYGNRLQNYAVQQVLRKNGFENVETIKNIDCLNVKSSVFEYGLRKIKSISWRIKESADKSLRRKCFKEFNKNIIFSKKYFSMLKNYNDFDYFIVGSDQVWNPTFKKLRDFQLLNFKTDAKKVAFSASFGISKLPDENIEKTKNALSKFDYISVREDAGKTIINEIVKEKDVTVLVDPTMLLTAEEWGKLQKKPIQLKTDRYILTYFLGKLSDSRKEEINRIARENNCEVINLEPDSPYFQSGPSEFLYLEKNAFAICTDSFHSCVFAILFNRPFIIFDREDSLTKMNSRIDTLVKKFNLKNRKFNNKITEENLNHDYSEAYEILNMERQKANDFLKKALDVK